MRNTVTKLLILCLIVSECCLSADETLIKAIGNAFGKITEQLDRIEEESYATEPAQSRRGGRSLRRSGRRRARRCRRKSGRTHRRRSRGRIRHR